MFWSHVTKKKPRSQDTEIQSRCILLPVGVEPRRGVGPRLGGVGPFRAYTVVFSSLIMFVNLSHVYTCHGFGDLFPFVICDMWPCIDDDVAAAQMRMWYAVSGIRGDIMHLNI